MANDKTMAHRFPVNLPAASGDVAEAIVTVLYDLNLLPTKDDLDQAGDAGASFRGPPQSVAVIESGATALAKWWAVAGSGVLGGLWISVAAFWRNNTDIRGQMLWSAAIVSAAIMVGVAYLLASDVRGRAAAMVETVTARKDVAKAIIDATLRWGALSKLSRRRHRGARSGYARGRVR